jgi:hypothetical protein
MSLCARHLALFAIVALAACGRDGTAPTPPGTPTDFPATPDRLAIVLDDLPRFWRAYDDFTRTADPAAFQRRYLDSASTGLREFIALRAVTASAIAQAVTPARGYYDAIRPVTDGLTAADPVFATIRANAARLEALYPAAVHPPVTLLFGRFSTGGTIGRAGLLLGAEFYGRDVTAPLDALTPFARANLRALRTELPDLVMHEHIHVLQLAAGARGFADGQTLLARALMEGGADFVAELVTGRASYARLFAQWQPREAATWAEFQRELGGTAIDRWLYNQGSPTATAERPGDLGYFMGYRIAQAYYARQADKAAALRTLIAQADPARILAESGYAGSGPPIAAP